MKHLFIFIIIILQTLIVCSQKHDFNWIFGYDFADNPRDTTEGINFMKFNTVNGSPTVTYEPKIKNDFDQYGCIISDKNGNFVFSFSGNYVEDYRPQRIGGFAFCPYDECKYLTQGSCIIPNPVNTDSSYFLLTEEDTITNPTDSTLFIYADEFYYSELLESTNHKGIIIKSAHKLILADSFDVGKIAYCKHANGRDWWIILPGVFNNKFYTFLLTDRGIKLNAVQQVGNFRNFGSGFSCFSQNGLYYAIATKDDNSLLSGSEFDFYHFDRGTGILSEHQNFKLDSTESISAGVAFSPDNKILYACSAGVLYQYPIKNGKLNHRIEIAKYDGFLSFLFGSFSGQTYFGQLQNGPDGRIYCNSDFLQTRHMHVINKPNEIGAACDFRQHSIPFPSIKKTMPYFPNYRLGPIDGSISDSLGIDNIPWCWWRYDQDTLDHLTFEFTDLSAYEVEEWFWDFGDGTTSIMENNVHHYQQNGNYEVCLIVKNKNGADTLCRTLHIGTVSAENINQPIEIQIFPNPCDEYLYVNVPDYNPENMKISLYNLEGKSIISQRLFQGSNYIDVTKILPGIYFNSISEKGIIIHSEKFLKL